MDLVPASAARTARILPEDKIPRLKFALLDLDSMVVTVIRLIRGANPEVSTEFGIDLTYRPADEAGAVELVVAFRSEHIGCSELGESHSDHFPTRCCREQCEDVIDIGVTAYVNTHQSRIVGAVFRLHHFIKDLTLIIGELEMIRRFTIVH